MGRRRRRWLLLLLVAASAGCAGTLREISSGWVGCPPETIEIRNDSGFSFGARAWQAACAGKVFQCSSTGNANACSELRVAPPPAR